jgi:hypothetical protein
MEKGILNIQLAKRPPSSDLKKEDKMNSSGFDNKIECILVVNVIPLFESLGNQACLVLLYRSISMFSDFPHPFQVNNPNPSRGRN